MNENDNQISFRLPFYEQMQQNFQKMQEAKPKQQRKKLAIEIERDKQIQEELDRQIAEAQKAYQGTPIIEVGKQEATISKADNVSAPVRKINNYVNKAKYKLSHGEPLGGEYTLPAIGLTALGVGAATSAPLATATSIVGGAVGGKVTDKLSQLITGNTWAQNIFNVTGLVPEAAEITNPGYYIGGRVGTMLPYKVRVALYNNKSPFGYGNNINSRKIRVPNAEPLKTELKNMIKDFFHPLKWKPNENPRWKEIIQQNGTESNLILDMPNGAAAEFRDMIYRKALRFPENKNGTIFVDNGDGTLGVNIDKINTIRKKYGGQDYNGRLVQFVNKTNGNSFLSGDNVAGVGGCTRATAYPNIENPQYVISEDVWDIQPFQDWRSIWKWGTKHVPGLKNLEMIKLLGGKPPKVIFKVDNPKLLKAEYKY